MENKAIQDKWPEIGTYCWGCGRNNEQGLQIKSYWEGVMSVFVLGSLRDIIVLILVGDVEELLPLFLIVTV